MDVDGEAALDEAQHILVEGQGKVGMMAPLQEDLGPAEVQRFFDLPGQFSFLVST